MLNPRSVQCLRLIAPSLPSVPSLTASSSLSRNRKLCHPKLTVATLSRTLTVSRSKLGREAHGVTQEANLPPGSTKDGKSQPVAEEEREALRDVYPSTQVAKLIQDRADPDREEMRTPVDLQDIVEKLNVAIKDCRMKNNLKLDSLSPDHQKITTE